MMTVIEIDPCTDARWQQIITRHPSDVFHSPAWMTVLSRTYGFSPRALIRLDEDGDPVAGLPFCEVTDLFPTRLVCLPFSDFCDPLIRHADDWRALSDVWVERQHDVLVRCRQVAEPENDDRFQPAKSAIWHGVDLRGSNEENWQRLSGSVRRTIRKGQKSDLTIRPAERHELRRFFELHLAVRKNKYRLVAQPFAFFEAIWDAFVAPGNGQLLVALKGETMVSGVMYLRWQNRVYYKFNASDPSYLDDRPNDILLWRGITEARTAGAQRLDLGLSDADQPGLLHYKRKYATVERPLIFWRAAARDAGPRVAAVKALLPRLTDLFTDETVPDHITEQAGNLLYRYFT